MPERQNATSRIFTFPTKNGSGFFSKDKKSITKRARLTLFCDYKWVKNIQVCMENLKMKQKGGKLTYPVGD